MVSQHVSMRARQNLQSLVLMMLTKQSCQYVLLRKPPSLSKRFKQWCCLRAHYKALAENNMLEPLDLPFSHSCSPHRPDIPHTDRVQHPKSLLSDKFLLQEPEGQPWPWFPLVVRPRENPVRISADSCAHWRRTLSFQK